MSAWRATAAALGAVAALAALYSGIRFLGGGDVGAPCGSAGDCRAFWNARCLSTPGRHDLAYCTVPCQSAAACPHGFSCGPALEIRDSALTAELTVCLAPEDAAESVPPALASILRTVAPEASVAAQRRELSSRALILFDRARAEGAGDVARASSALDGARYDCASVHRAAADVKRASDALAPEVRERLAGAVESVERAVARLCP